MPPQKLENLIFYITVIIVVRFSMVAMYCSFRSQTEGDSQENGFLMWGCVRDKLAPTGYKDEDTLRILRIIA